MFFSLYFWKISKYWIGNAYIALALALISLVGAIFFLPESPRYTYSKKEFARTRKILEAMMKMNRVNFKDKLIFEDEVPNENEER